MLLWSLTVCGRRHSKETASRTAPLWGKGFYCKGEKMFSDNWTSPEQREKRNRLDMAGAREAREWEKTVEIARAVERAGES